MSDYVILAAVVAVGVSVGRTFGFRASLEFGFVASVALIAKHYLYREKPKYPSRLVHNMLVSTHHGNDAVGVVAIVTGSTSGIGQRIAEELYRYGATVVIASRNEAKSADVMADLRVRCPGCKGELVWGKLDTSDLDSVRDFAAWFGGKFEAADYLVNNAGIQYASSAGEPLKNLSAPIISKQGYDDCFVTNYLGHFLLTHLLLPKLRLRVINIASSFHFQADGTTLDPLLGPGGRPQASIEGGFTHRMQAYGVSKLAQVLHSNELQRRFASLGHPNLKAISVCPGWVDTHILGETLGARIIGTNAFNVDEGILSPMAAIFDPLLKGGEYVLNEDLPFRMQPWFDPILAKLTKSGWRDYVLFAFAGYLNLVQYYSYGYRALPCSPEASDPRLAKDFYEWSLQTLKDKNYITA
ncbi:hypothetical protein B484DRAFT_453586 [Ochromonadaceae sp. CCMP2298]|nr:hypothetical protein B484DRAFT_453586 [Ochromonadaceae sp. CCMP2298]